MDVGNYGVSGYGIQDNAVSYNLVVDSHADFMHSISNPSYDRSRWSLDWDDKMDKLFFRKMKIAIKLALYQSGGQQWYTGQNIN